MDIRPIELIGKRAKLVPLEEAHIPALYEVGRDSRIWQYLPRHITTPEDMERFIQDILQEQARGDTVAFTIIDQASQRIVGSTRWLDISSADRHLEIGTTWHTPQVWGSGINTECKYLLLRHCFETLALLRVQLKTDRRNLRSQRAIERLGATREGVLRHHMVMPDGYLRDSVYYSILLEEWPASKQLLESRLS